jgi:hypothetical protein
MMTNGVHKLGIVRFALTGAIASSVFFVFCWIGGQIPIGTLSHMYVQLFTRADLGSMAALVEGALWSIGFGLIGGALIAAAYNLLAPLERK